MERPGPLSAAKGPESNQRPESNGVTPVLTPTNPPCKCELCVSGVKTGAVAPLGPRPHQPRGTPPDGNPDRGPSVATALFCLTKPSNRASGGEGGERRPGGVGGEPGDQRESGGGALPPGAGPGAPLCGERARENSPGWVGRLMRRYAERQANGERHAGVSNTPLHNTSAQPERGAVASKGEGREGFSPPAGGAGGTPRLRSVERASAQNTTPPGPNEGGGGAGRLLACRVDWLTVAYRVEIDPGVYDRLELVRQDATRAPGGKAPFEVWGTPFAVHRKLVREGEIMMGNADADILVSRRRRKDDQGNDAGPEWNVEISFRSAYLATHTHFEIGNYSRSLAAFFAEKPTDVLGERVRRVDWAADAELAIDFETTDRPGFVGRMKRVADYLRDPVKEGDAEGRHAVNTYWRPGKGDEALTGFTFAPGADLQARLYDKTKQLELFEPEHEKRAIEAALWERGGWQGGRVWRLEFQVRRPILDEFKIRTLDDLWPKLNIVWKYCSESWLRKIVADSATRRERAQLDARWLVYQSARFGAGEVRVVRRERAKRGGPDKAQLVGTLQAYLAALGIDADPYDRTRTDERGLFVLKDPEILFRENLEVLATMGHGLGARYTEAALAQRARFASSDDDTPCAEPQRKAG